MTFDFENRTLVLTEANGGIGCAIADLDGNGLDAFAASLGGGERIATIRADASSAEDAEKTVALAAERFGGIDFLVPSAGIYQAKPFAEMSDADRYRTISVNLDGVAPGIVETPMTRELLKTRMEETMSQTPLGRLGKPSEIASVIAFLCSPAASFVTGETIQVNGGIYMA